MNDDPFYPFGVRIPRNMRSLFDDEDRFPRVCLLARTYRAKQAGADDQIVIHGNSCPPRRRTAPRTTEAVCRRLLFSRHCLSSDRRVNALLMKLVKAIAAVSAKQRCGRELVSAAPAGRFASCTAGNAAADAVQRFVCQFVGFLLLHYDVSFRSSRFF